MRALVDKFLIACLKNWLKVEDILMTFQLLLLHSLTIPGELLLAQAERGHYYPGRIESFNSKTNKYKVLVEGLLFFSGSGLTIGTFADICSYTLVLNRSNWQLDITLLWRESGSIRDIKRNF